MEFSIKGMTFKEDELIEVAIGDFEVNKIAKDHIVHIMSGSRKCFILLRAGEILTQEFIDKYTNKNVEVFKTLPVASEPSIQVYKDLWIKLKNSTSQKQQLQVKDEVLLTFLKENQKDSEGSILNFVISCFEEFYQLPLDVMMKFQAKSYLMFTRALLMSSFSAISSLAHGISDYDYIKDFFNTTLFLDYGLVEFKDFNYMLSMACESERSKPGSGESYLELHGRSQEEIFVFRDHPNRSVRALKEFAQYFKNKEVIELIRFHHEKVDGSGFPAGLYYSGLSQTEMLLSFCDNLVPFEEHIFAKEDGHKFVSMYFENLNTLMKGRMLPVSGILESWRGIIEWNKKREVQG